MPGPCLSAPFREERKSPWLLRSNSLRPWFADVWWVMEAWRSARPGRWPRPVPGTLPLSRASGTPSSCAVLRRQPRSLARISGIGRRSRKIWLSSKWMTRSPPSSPFATICRERTSRAGLAFIRRLTLPLPLGSGRTSPSIPLFMWETRPRSATVRRSSPAW